MDIKLNPGKYILAISGGVDSMVLLDLVVKKYLLNSNYQSEKYLFVVAHFDHGIRDDSIQDRLLVSKTAQQYLLPFEYRRVDLDETTSEDYARQLRYDYLKSVMKQYQADSIITAHHLSDVVETAIFNVLRGTGRKGLTALAETNEIKRPLLGYTKQNIIKYALDNKLIWREDKTNKNLKYSRNLIRLTLIPKFSNEDYLKLIGLINDQRIINGQLDSELNKMLNNSKINYLDRLNLINLPDNFASELLASWFRLNKLRDFDKKTIYRILNGSKIARSGAKYDVKHNFYVLVTKQYLALKHIER